MLEINNKDNISFIGVCAGIIIFLFFFLTESPEGLSRTGWLTLGIAILMAVWWMSEAIPIYATGLVPLLAFPILNILDIKEASNSYAHPLNLLFLGGFIIAACMQDSLLHKRIALNIINIFGTSPSRIIAGFMIATSVLSMGVSNTASTIMMLPIALSVISLFEGVNNSKNKENDKFALPLLLSIAYSASIGGMATLIGTPTNIMLAGVLSNSYNYQIGFLEWFMIGFPLVLFMIPSIWFFLTRIIFKVTNESNSKLKESLIIKKNELGKITYHEKIVAFVFSLVALLWIFRRKINSLFPDFGINDTSIAIFGALLLFIIPISKSKRACSWDVAIKIPWGVLFLIGGGLCLSSAFKTSGLANWLGSYAYIMKDLNIYLLILFTVAITIFLTELNSNTATVATFSPILIIFAINLGINPLILVIPATFAASCAFMLPSATAPNAVVYGSGLISINKMLKTGILLNFYSILIVSIISLFLLRIIFNIEFNSLPNWVEN